MTRKQKREYLAMQAKVERLEAELALARSSVHTPPTSTTANNVTEDAISPSASLAAGVDPDADSSGTSPLKDISVSGRASSSIASLSKGVESDTAPTDTVSPGSPSVTEEAIPPTASSLLQVIPATVRTEAEGAEPDTARADAVSPSGSNVTEGAIHPTASLLHSSNPTTVKAVAEPQGCFDHARSTAEEIVALQMISTLGTSPDEGLASSPGHQVTEVRTEDVTDNPSDETSVATVTLDTTSKEDNTVSPRRSPEDEPGPVMAHAISPNNPRDSHSEMSSQTLSQLHAALESHLKMLNLSPLGEQPPGHTPPATPAREALARSDLTGSVVDPSMPKMISSGASPSGAQDRAQDPITPFFKNPNFFGSAIKVIGKEKSAIGVSSKKSTSSKSKGMKRSGLISWGRVRVPQMVSFASGTAFARKTKDDSRLSPDDSFAFRSEDDTGARPTLTDDILSPDDPVTSTHEDDTVARPTLTGDAPTILIGETTSVAPTSPNDETPSDVTVSHANKVPPEVQTSHEGKIKVEPDLVVKRLLTKPKGPVSLPDPSPPPAPGSIEGISSITLTSSSNATSSIATPPFLGPPSPQDDPAQKVGELPAAALKKPPAKPSSRSTTRVEPKPAPTLPGPKPPPSAPKGTKNTGNVESTSKPQPLAPEATGSTGDTAAIPGPNKMWGVLPLASPDASASGSTLTATQKEVESLVGGTSDITQGPTVVPPVRPTSIDSSFFWVASLPSCWDLELPVSQSLVMGGSVMSHARVLRFRLALASQLTGP